MEQIRRNAPAGRNHVPFRARFRIVPAVAPMIVVLLLFTTAWAESERGLWERYRTHAAGCEAPLEGSAPEGARCLWANGLGLMLQEGLRVADAYGKTAFGRHFQAVGRWNPAPFSDGVALYGDVDMVLPFAGAGVPSGRQPSGGQEGSALFFQQGLTRSWDENGSGLFRNDLRHGVVRRFRTSTAGMFGVSVFHLLNTERGHRVVMSGLDYAGRWGVGSLRYHLPTTGWRPGGSGRQERALAGLEVGMRFDLTTTLRLDATGYRWRAEDGSRRWDTGARMDFGWQPHPWLKFAAGYDGFGRGTSNAIFHVALKLPLGARSRPAWQGLGVAADPSPPGPEDLWRPAGDIGPIRVARRDAVADLARQARVRFLQNTARSGDTVRLEVTLAAAAPQDMRIVVRLVPGSGENPAVPGEDFVDQPVETTIRQGSTRSTVSVPLLRNHRMTRNRSLGATVSIAA